jgi:hypothetical protein
MQNVIAARDFDLFLNFDAIGVAFKVQTGANFSATISGTTDDIGAFSTDEPIATDNGGNTYDISFSLQQAEANRIKDALAAATANSPQGSIAHIRQIVESATITAVYNKRRDVPPTATTETYTRCTGVEESDNVERRSTETLKSWRFRARGMKRTTLPLL